MWGGWVTNQILAPETTDPTQKENYEVCFFN